MLACIKKTGSIFFEHRRAVLIFGMVIMLIVVHATSAMPDDSSKPSYKKAVPAVTLTDEEKIWLNAHPVIRIGVDAGFAPYAFVDAQGKFQGVAADFAYIISEMLGIEMKMVPGLSWPEIIQASKDKTIDLITTASYRPEREVFLNFTQGYIATPFVIMSRTGDERIKDRADISNLKVAMVKGYNASKSVMNEFKEIKALYVDTPLEGLHAVAVGEADTYVGVLGINIHQAQRGGITNLKVAALYDHKKEITYQRYGVRKDWPILANILDKALTAIPEEKINHIFQKWVSMEKSQKKPGTINLTDQEAAWLKNHPVIRVGADPSWAPIEFLGNDGNYKGLSIDYLKKIEPLLGIRFEFIRENWQELIIRARKHQLDLFPCVSRTPERDKFLIFTKPYIQMPAGIFVGKEVAYISGLDKIAGKQIAVVKNYAIHDYFVANYPKIDLVLAQTPAEGIRYIQNEKAYAFIGNTITTGHLLSHKGNFEIKLAGEISFVFSQRMGVRKDWPLLRDILQKAIDTFPDAERNAIYNQWVPVNYEKPLDYSLFWKIGAACVVIVVLILIWNRILASQVLKRTSALQNEVHDRKQAQLALKESEKKFRALADTSPLAIYMSEGVEQKAVYINPTFTKLFGYTIDEVPTVDHWWPLAYPDADYRMQITDEWQKRAEHAIITKSAIEPMEVIVTCKDGSKKDISWGFITTGKQNWACGFDLTERKQAEEQRATLENQLRHSHKIEAIGTLAGGIAHDFNNILAAILGYADMAMDDIPDYSPAKYQINEVLKAGNRAKELVKHILAFSRKETQKRLPVQIHLIAKEALKLLRATIPATVDIRQDIDSQCGNILSDPTQIHQIIMNLCTNAAQAMDDKGGILSIQLTSMQLGPDDLVSEPNLKPGVYVRLAVKDNGIGIAKKDIDKIFDPYFTTKGVGKGSGMGLAVVIGIVKNHNGMITVDSNPDAGTTFKVYFPKIEEQVQEDIPEAASLPRGKERILIIDDEKMIVEMTKLRLERLGYQATTKTNSLEALELFRSHPDEFDLIISDQTMPELTGDKLAKKILTIRPDIPIIICTGHSSKIDAEKANYIGVSAFMMKPVEKIQFTKTIRQVLDNRKV